jgi:hypothetical protein
MALTLSILKLTRKTLTLFFFFLHFAIFGADDPPAYAHIETDVRDKNISSLFVIKELWIPSHLINKLRKPDY